LHTELALEENVQITKEIPDTMECPRCHGEGTREGRVCEHCSGTGRIPVERVEADD
jgi:uncharacterized phage protein